MKLSAVFSTLSRRFTLKDYTFKIVGAALLTLAALTAAIPAKAAPTSLLDPSRLSVGARAYRSFDEKPGVAGSYTSGWWAGVSAAWELTSPNSANVKFPVSVIGAADFGIPAGSQKQTVRGYVGLGFLLKGAK